MYIVVFTGRKSAGRMSTGRKSWGPSRGSEALDENTDEKDAMTNQVLPASHMPGREHGCIRRRNDPMELQVPLKRAKMTSSLHGGKLLMCV